MSDSPEGPAGEASANATHEMHLVRRDAREGDEWHCPTCGRRILLRMPPRYARRVVEAGDEHALHTGMKGLVVGPAPSDPDPATPPDPTSPTAPADEVTAQDLEAWRNWVQEGGLEDWLRDQRP